MEEKKLVDFHCTYDQSAGVRTEVTEGLGLTFPDAYLHADTMAILAKRIREYDGSEFCELPLCHTVEAEAMGGKITLGDEKAGPRAKEYVCASMEELLELPEIDFSTGRIREVLLACRKLTEEGEDVVLQVSGPFTILNVLIDAGRVFRCLRKNPELAMQVFWKLGRQVLRFIEEAQNCGVRFISYADSAGGVGILGPKMAAQVVDGFTDAFVREMLGIARDDTMILLCPKTAFALIGTDRAAWRDVPIGETMSYTKACVRLSGKVKLAGMMCIKNAEYRIENGVFRELVMRP